MLAWLDSGSSKMANRYPDIKVLAHKDTFGRAMKFAIDQDPEAFDFVPPTFELPNSADEARFAAYKKQHPQATFIAKPQVGAQGDSICLFKEMKDLPYMLNNKEIIVQRYLDRPLLLNGFKFDLRVYVCVFGLNPV